MGDAYKSAADELEKINTATLQHLPICFLRRHAVELYLKSITFLLHKTFPSEHTLPKENDHDLVNLDNYIIEKLKTNAKILHERSKHKPDFSWNQELSGEIGYINDFDSRSTYFRYPITKDKAKDHKKNKLMKQARKKFKKI